MTPNPKAQIAAAYDAAADHFDDPVLSFRDYYGEQTAARAQLRPGEIVLDVCSGTGASAIPAARTVGPPGRVIGLDLAARLIALARSRAAAEALTNIEFRQADFDQAYFRNASFDAVLCAFGLVFFPDMRATLQKMWRLLRPGGRLVITTWGPGVFEPHGRVFWNAVREVRPELYKSADSWERLNSPELLRAAFEQADIEEERREHTLQTPADWWTMMMGSGHRATIEQLTPEEQAHVRAACLAITATTIPIPVLYAVASR